MKNGLRLIKLWFYIRSKRRDLDTTEMDEFEF